MAALVAFAVSGIGTLATEKSDLTLRDNPPAIAPEERDRSRLDFEFYEQNWNLNTGEVLDTGIPVDAAAPKISHDDIEFYEQNWHLHRVVGFDLSLAAAAALDAKRDEIESREQNWNLKTGEVLDTGTPVDAAAPKISHDDIEFYEQNWHLHRGEAFDLSLAEAAALDAKRDEIEFRESNWHLESGEMLDNGTPAAVAQNDDTSSVPAHGTYRVGPRLR